MKRSDAFVRCLIVPAMVLSVVVTLVAGTAAQEGNEDVLSPAVATQLVVTSYLCQTADQINSGGCIGAQGVSVAVTWDGSPVAGSPFITDETGTFAFDAEVGATLLLSEDPFTLLTGYVPVANPLAVGPIVEGQAPVAFYNVLAGGGGDPDPPDPVTTQFTVQSYLCADASQVDCIGAEGVVIAATQNGSAVPGSPFTTDENGAIQFDVEVGATVVLTEDPITVLAGYAPLTNPITVGPVVDGQPSVAFHNILNVVAEEPGQIVISSFTCVAAVGSGIEPGVKLTVAAGATAPQAAASCQVDGIVAFTLTGGDFPEEGSTVQTDGQGRRVLDLPPGDYTILDDLSGRVANITIAAGGTVQLLVERFFSNATSPGTIEIINLVCAETGQGTQIIALAPVPFGTTTGSAIPEDGSCALGNSPFTILPYGNDGEELLSFEVGADGVETRALERTVSERGLHLLTHVASGQSVEFAVEDGANTRIVVRTYPKPKAGPGAITTLPSTGTGPGGEPNRLELLGLIVVLMVVSYLASRLRRAGLKPPR